MRLFLLINAIIIVLIIIRRLIDGKIPRRVQYAMWLIIPICIACNFFFEIPVKYREPIRTRTISKSADEEIVNQYPSEIKTPVNTLVVEPDNQESVVTETENVTSNATKIENLTNTKTSSKTSIDYLVVLKNNY